MKVAKVGTRCPFLAFVLGSLIKSHFRRAMFGSGIPTHYVR